MRFDADRPGRIIGASGYSGLELSRILALHPQVELKLLGSDKWAGDTAARRAGLPGAAGKLRYAPQEKCAELSRECAVAFLATPADVSMELVPPAARIRGQGDRSVRRVPAARCGALSEALWVRARPPRSPFGGVLRASRACPRAARLPPRRQSGMLPDAAALVLAPLIDARLLAPDPLIVDAASGVTGAGRRAAGGLLLRRGRRRLPRVQGAASPTPARRSRRRWRGRSPSQLTSSGEAGNPGHLLRAARPGRKAGELQAALLHKYADAPSSKCWRCPIR